MYRYIILISFNHFVNMLLKFNEDSFELDLHTLKGCYVQCSYLMSLLSPVKHPKLQGCYVIHKYCIEEEFNIVNLKGWSLYFLLRIVLSTKKQVVICTRNEEAFVWNVLTYLIYCISCISPYSIHIVSVHICCIVLLYFSIWHLYCMCIAVLDYGESHC